MKMSAKHALRMLVAVCAVVVAVGAPAGTAAVKASPCWVKLLNDWYDGRIDKVYPIPCYQDAIDHLPTDIRVYSSAREDIDRALAAAIAHEKNPNAPVPVVTEGSTTTTTASGSGPGTTTTKGRTTPSGPIPSAIDSSSPGGATSFPLPLLILGGLALFLLAAGVVGLVVRRMQGRGPKTP